MDKLAKYFYLPAAKDHGAFISANCLYFFGVPSLFLVFSVLLIAVNMVLFLVSLVLFLIPFVGLPLVCSLGSVLALCDSIWLLLALAVTLYCLCGFSLSALSFCDIDIFKLFAKKEEAAEESAE